MSDLEYVNAVINAVESVYLAAIDFLNADEEQERDHDEVMKCYYQTETRLNELRSLLGLRLVEVARVVGHVDPTSWGLPFVQQTMNTCLDASGPHAIIGPMQRRYHELLTWRFLLAGPCTDLAPGKGKTEKPDRAKNRKLNGDARTKIIATLTEHHNYNNGAIGNYLPIGVGELAKKAQLGSKSTVTKFFTDEWGNKETGSTGWPIYRSICCNPARHDKLSAWLMILNGDNPMKGLPYKE